MQRADAARNLSKHVSRSSSSPGVVVVNRSRLGGRRLSQWLERTYSRRYPAVARHALGALSWSVLTLQVASRCRRCQHRPNQGQREPRAFARLVDHRISTGTGRRSHRRPVAFDAPWLRSSRRGLTLSSVWPTGLSLFPSEPRPLLLMKPDTEEKRDCSGRGCRITSCPLNHRGLRSASDVVG